MAIIGERGNRQSRRWPPGHDRRRIIMRSIHEGIFLMQQSKISVAFALVLLCAGCGRQTTVTTAPAPVATEAATQHAVAQADPDAQCKSWGIQPGSPDFKRCVDGMTEAANAGGPQSAEQVQAEMAKMRADMAHQGDDVRKQ